MNHKYIAIGLDPSFLQNKQYDLLALFAAYESTYLSEDDRVIVDMKYYRKKLEGDFNFTKYKKQTVIDTLIALGVLTKQEQNKDCEITLTKPPFIKLKYNMAEFCAKHLTSNEFKVYCFLLHKQHAKKNYGFDNYYYFSEKQLLEAIGYCGVSQKNIRLMTSILSRLKELKLIDYNKESFARPGAKGTYHALYHVTEMPPQISEETELPKRSESRPKTRESLFLYEVPPAAPVEFARDKNL